MHGADRMLAALAARAGERADTQARSGWGLVTSYDPATDTARVTTEEGVLTGWLPVLRPALGNGWGFVSGLQPGTQVFMSPHGGDAEHLVIMGSAASVVAPPPSTYTDPQATGTTTPVQAGEFAIVHQSGLFIRLTAEGFVIHGPVAIQGELRVAGDVYDATGSLSALRGHFNAHVHSGVQPGSGQTGAPTVLDNSGDDTPAPDPFLA